jgi:hypothetical protein
VAAEADRNARRVEPVRAEPTFFSILASMTSFNDLSTVPVSLGEHFP